MVEIESKKKRGAGEKCGGKDDVSEGKNIYIFL